MFKEAASKRIAIYDHQMETPLTVDEVLGAGTHF